MLLLSVALPVVTGYFVINALWPDQKFFSSFAIKSSLAIGLGFGISSYIFFISIVSLNVINDFFIPLELFVLFVLTALSLTSIFKRNGYTGYTVDQEHFSRHSQMLLIRGFWIALALSILFFIIRSFNNPHGEWDAWAIWNMRARFLYRSGSNWLNAFSNIYGWSHPDYPLLLSSNVARIWHYCKGETTIGPIFIAFLFTYGYSYADRFVGYLFVQLSPWSFGRFSIIGHCLLHQAGDITNGRCAFRIFYFSRYCCYFFMLFLSGKKPILSFPRRPHGGIFGLDKK